MYCPKCGAVTEQQTKFCKSCGLRLVEHAQLLDGQEQGGKNKKLIWKGTEFLLGSWLAVFLFFLVSSLPFVLSGEQAIANDYSDLSPFRRVLAILMMMAIPTIIGGIGAIYLLRGGFFDNFRKRKIEEEMEELEKELEKKRKKREAQSNLKLNPSAIAAEAVSAIESTTRQLEPVAVDTGKIEGE